MPNKKRTRSRSPQKTTARKTSSAAPTQEIDIVEEAKKELKKLEENQNFSDHETAHSPHFPWGIFLGGIFLAAIVFIVAGWANRTYLVPQTLAKKLPDIITPLGGGMVLETVGTPEYKSGIYEFKIKFVDTEEEFTSSITSDGKFFFTNPPLDVAEILASVDGSDTGGAEVSAATCESVSKQAAPELAAYIVADCPYGKQMQTVMLNAINEAPELASNFKVRYFFEEINDDGSVMAMHGEAEAIENLRQICIREEQASLYWSYVDCYANSTATNASETCLGQVGVDVAAANACMSSTTRGLAWAREDNSLSQLHNVSGSPTLVLNDLETVQESNFGGRTAEGLKSVVCCSADQALPFCGTTLSDAATAASGNCE